MFVRKKKNRSGSVSVQVIDKSKTYRVVKTIGSSKYPDKISRMFEMGKLYIERQSKQYSLFPNDQQNNAAVLDFARNIQNSQVRTIGPELIFGKIVILEISQNQYTKKQLKSKLKCIKYTINLSLFGFFRFFSCLKGEGVRKKLNIFCVFFAIFLDYFAFFCIIYILLVIKE
jgi:hypothetical protein